MSSTAIRRAMRVSQYPPVLYLRLAPGQMSPRKQRTNRQAQNESLTAGKFTFYTESGRRRGAGIRLADWANWRRAPSWFGWGRPPLEDSRGPCHALDCNRKEQHESLQLAG